MCLAADEGHTVIVAGLDGDFKRKRFGQVVDLTPLADAVVKLTAECAICGSPAPFTARTVDEMDQTLVGGAESYVPVCRRHYMEHGFSWVSACSPVPGKKASEEACETAVRPAAGRA